MKGSPNENSLLEKLKILFLTLAPRLLFLIRILSKHQENHFVCKEFDEKTVPPILKWKRFKLQDYISHYFPRAPDNLTKYKAERDVPLFWWNTLKWKGWNIWDQKVAYYCACWITSCPLCWFAALLPINAKSRIDSASSRNFADLSRRSKWKGGT